MSPRLPPDPDEIDGVVQTVFDERPFTSPAPPLEDAIAYLGDLRLALSEALNALSVSSPVAYWLVVGSLLLLLVALVAHISWSLTAVFRAASPTPGLVGTAAPARGSTSLGPARDALARGDTRRAVELAWTAVVTAATAADDPPPASLQTPRQLATWMAPRLGDERAERLGRLLRAHERSCYAGRAPTPRVAETALDDAAALVPPGAAD